MSENNDFCKVFNDQIVGQVLVMNEDVDGKPAVVIYFTPRNLGICNSAFKFSDNDNGYKQCDNLFYEIDYDKAVAIVSELLAEMKLKPVGEESK